MSERGLLPREQAILTEIVEYYIARHEAVSARTLSKISHLALSPTTIRNLMEDLSEEGYLTHRGAARGRLPTRKAFYIYISSVCGGSAPARERGEPERSEPAPGLALEEVLQRVGAELAEGTGYAAVAALPAREDYPLDWVRLAPVAGKQVLVSVGTPFGEVWSKVVASAELFPSRTLAEVEAYLNRTFRGKALAAIRGEIMSGEPKALLEDAPSLGAAFRVLRKAFVWEEPPAWLVWGEERLLGIKEMRDPDKMLRLHRALHDRALLSRAAGKGRAVEGGLVAIGSEVGIAGLDDIALVGFPFGWEPERPALMAVVGPIHMDYARVVQQVRGAADRLNRAIAAALAPRAGAARFNSELRGAQPAGEHSPRPLRAPNR